MNDIILNKYAIIQRCIARVYEEYRGHEAELATNYTRQDSIILNIQRACQAALDMANYVIRLKKLGIPQNARESFQLLGDNGLVSAPLTGSMKKMVGFRNIAVHEYQKLNIDILKSVIENHINDINGFAEEVMRNVNRLDENESPGSE